VKKGGKEKMASKLEEAKQKLLFVSRSLANGYIDFDTLDELERELSCTIRLINEHENSQQSLEVHAYHVTVYKPVKA
jgi:hypothetical protein